MKTYKTLEDYIAENGGRLQDTTIENIEFINATLAPVNFDKDKQAILENVIFKNVNVGRLMVGSKYKLKNVIFDKIKGGSRFTDDISTYTILDNVKFIGTRGLEIKPYSWRKEIENQLKEIQQYWLKETESIELMLDISELRSHNVWIRGVPIDKIKYNKEYLAPIYGEDKNQLMEALVDSNLSKAVADNIRSWYNSVLELAVEYSIYDEALIPFSQDIEAIEAYQFVQDITGRETLNKQGILELKKDLINKPLRRYKPTVRKNETIVDDENLAKLKLPDIYPWFGHTSSVLENCEICFDKAKVDTWTIGSGHRLINTTLNLKNYNKRKRTSHINIDSRTILDKVKLIGEVGFYVYRANSVMKEEIENAEEWFSEQTKDIEWMLDITECNAIDYEVQIIDLPLEKIKFDRDKYIVLHSSYLDLFDNLDLSSRKGYFIERRIEKDGSLAMSFIVERLIYLKDKGHNHMITNIAYSKEDQIHYKLKMTEKMQEEIRAIVTRFEDNKQ